MPATKKTAAPKRISQRAIALALENAPKAKSYDYPLKPPHIPKAVVPVGATAPVLAMDWSPYGIESMQAFGGGFPGFAYLSQLATRSEYRAFASSLSTELTREWIKFIGKGDDESNTQRIAELTAEFKRLDVRSIITHAAEHDAYFGRAQIFLDIDGQQRDLPLILDKAIIPKGARVRLSTVEAIWTTPMDYNAIDPASPAFYKPMTWFMLGQKVHASRLMTIITRPLPDVLKPAFNFAGMSLSQLAEPYVDNWIRTRQSVSNLIYNFSVTALQTDMGQILQGTDAGASLLLRAQLFNANKSNQGLMLLDKEREELVQVNTPLNGLHELQSQSQEQMCAVSRMPAVILTGISPQGLNPSADGEIRVFYDWIAAQQEAHWRPPIEVIFKIAQLSLWGEIDSDIDFEFVPLFQMTPKELSEIRAQDATAGVAYIGAGVIDPQEERERLARDPSSGYQGLDTSKVPPPSAVPPGPDDEPPAGLEHPTESEGNTLGKAGPAAKPAQDEFNESDHPRSDNGEFGSGGAGGKISSGKNRFGLST